MKYEFDNEVDERQRRETVTTFDVLIRLLLWVTVIVLIGFALWLGFAVNAHGGNAANTFDGVKMRLDDGQDVSAPKPPMPPGFDPNEPQFDESLVATVVVPPPPMPSNGVLRIELHRLSTGELWLRINSKMGGMLQVMVPGDDEGLDAWLDCGEIGINGYGPEVIWFQPQIDYPNMLFRLKPESVVPLEEGLAPPSLNIRIEGEDET